MLHKCFLFLDSHSMKILDGFFSSLLGFIAKYPINKLRMPTLCNQVHRSDSPELREHVTCDTLGYTLILILDENWAIAVRAIFQQHSKRKCGDREIFQNLFDICSLADSYLAILQRASRELVSSDKCSVNVRFLTDATWFRETCEAELYLRRHDVDSENQSSRSGLVLER